jgi:hypothetical protein
MTYARSCFWPSAVANGAAPATNSDGTRLHSAARNGAADELYARRLGELVDEDDFPFISTALGSGSLTDSEGDFADDEFLFGLQTVLDGIAALVERREAGRQGR